LLTDGLAANAAKHKGTQAAQRPRLGAKALSKNTQRAMRAHAFGEKIILRLFTVTPVHRCRG